MKNKQTTNKQKKELVSMEVDEMLEKIHNNFFKREMTTLIQNVF